MEEIVAANDVSQFRRLQDMRVRNAGRGLGLSCVLKFSILLLTFQ